MNSYKKTIKNFISLLSGNFIGQAIGFINAAYLARVLGKDMFGVLNFWQTFILYFVIISNLGLSMYFIREENKSENNNLVSKVTSLRFYLSIVAFIIFISVILFHKNSSIDFNIIIILGVSLLGLGNNTDYLYISKKDMKYVSISIILRNIIWFVLNLIFVKLSEQLFLTAIFYTISIMIETLYLRYRYKIKYGNITLLKINKLDLSILKQSLPLAFSFFMIQINNNFDILFIGITRSKAEVAVYSSAYKIINFLMAMVIAYCNCSYANIAKIYNESHSELSNYINKFYNFGIMMFLPIALGGIALSKQMMNFVFGAQYEEGYIVFSILLLVILFRMISSTFSTVLLMGKYSNKFTYAVLLGSIFNIILNVMLIPNYGINAAAIVTVITEILQGSYMYIFFKKECKLNILNNTYKYLICSIIMFITLLYLNYNIFINIIIGVIVYFVFLGALNLKNIKYYYKKI